MSTAISGPNANSANPPTGDAAEFAPAGQSQCFGSTTPSVSVVRGLDPGCAYTFTFYGSRVGVPDNRDTRFHVVGATAGSNILATANNTSAVAIVPFIRPTGAGDITVTIDKGPKNTANAYYALAMKITQIPLATTLEVAGAPANYGSVTPPYGLTSGLEPDETLLCSAPTGTLVAADTWVTCAGYAIYTNSPQSVLAYSGTTNEVFYTHDGFARLVWQWAPTYLVSIIAGAGGTVDNSGGWYDAGETVTVTATPGDATRAFVKWSGDVPATQLHDPTLQLTCEGPLNITSHFGKAWYVAPTGSDTLNDGLTTETPFATIAKGIDSAAAGDVVLVGPGTYAILMAQAYPGLTCVTVDLPPVAAVAAELIREAGMEGRVTCRAGDYHTDSYEAEGYDAVTIFGALHQEPPEMIVQILKRCYDALKPGGRVYVMDMMTDETHTQPVFSALFAVNMALTTYNGWVFSNTELYGWLSEVGFEGCTTTSVPPPMPHWLVAAIKPDGFLPPRIPLSNTMLS